jgi:hypothetical protein
MCAYIYAAGIVGIARCSGLSIVENEILPQCWEQISHKHVERRLLVAESCIALAPYVSVSYGVTKLKGVLY